jgi:hypothetical protein
MGAMHRTLDGNRKTGGRSKLRRRTGSRRLTLETLESRHLLTELGGVVIDEIFPAGDIDSHPFLISQQHLDAAGGKVHITLSLSDSLGTFIPQAILVDQSGNQIGDLLGAGSKNRYELRTPGIYSVAVRDNDHQDVGGYAIGLAGLNPPSSDAMTIEPGDVRTGSLSPGQIATYTFTAAAGDLMTISLADTSSSDAGFLPRAELYYSATGQRLSLLGAAAGSTQWEMSAGNKYLTRPMPHTGLYVLQVYDNNYTHTHANGYAIALEGLSPPSENAVEISSGSVISGRIELGEIDAYRFVGAEGDLITLSLSDAVTGLTHRLWAELYAPSGTKVDKLTSTTGPDEVENGRKVIYQLPETATADNPYVIQVYDNNYADAEDYALSLQGLNPVCGSGVAMLPGDVLSGTIDEMGQVNTHYFTVTESDLSDGNGVYQVRVAFESETTIRYKPSAIVHLPSGRELTEVSPRQNKLLVLSEPGNYAIQVHDNDYTHTKQELIDRDEAPEYTLSVLDAQPPRVLSVAVTDSLLTDADVGASFGITVVFDETMDTSVTPNLVFTPDVAGVSGATLIFPSSPQWSSTHTAQDTFSVHYQVADQNVQAAEVRIGVTGARDAAGNSQQTYSAQPALAIDTRNPTASSFHPADGATRVAWDTDLTIDWSEPVQRGSGEIVIRRRSDDSAVETMSSDSQRVTVSGAQVAIDPQTVFDPETGYYVEVSGGAFRDLAGNASVAISGRTAWNFTTISIPARNAPYVARPLDDLFFLQGQVLYEVDLTGVFDDLDIPLGDQLTIEFDNAIDNTNPTLLTGELVSATLTLVFDPAQVGSAELTVYAKDLAGQTVSETFVVRIMASPVAVEDTVSTLQNEPIEIAVYENDFDPDGDVVPDTVQIVPDSGPYSGTVTLQSGVFTYTPSANFFGSDSFRYTIRDNDGWASNEALVTVTVIHVPPYHNILLPYDVDNSGGVSPFDALILINYINQAGTTLPPAPVPPAKPQYYFDVDGDGAVTPKDVLMVINYLNVQAMQGGEGEGTLARFASHPGGAPTSSQVHAEQATSPAGSSIPQRPATPDQQAPTFFPGPIEPRAGKAVFQSLGAEFDHDSDRWLGELLDELLLI